MEKTKRVYISGQMSGLKKFEYTLHFKKAAKYLRSNGYEPIDPSKVCCGENISYADVLLLDMKTIMDCGVIFMLDNWENSKGATAEYYFAKAIGLEIMFETDVDYDNN